MSIFSVIIFFVYMGLIIYIIPRAGLGFDLNEAQLSLLPYRFKLVAIAWFFASVIIALIFSNSIEKWDEYLVSCINLSFFVLIFSKQKSEDEFSTLIRFKSFTYSFVSFISMAGAFGAVGINQSESGFILNNLNIHLLVGVSMLIALLYFYVTIYKFSKENK